MSLSSLKSLFEATSYSSVLPAVAFYLIIFIPILIFLTTASLYLTTLENTLKAISIQNRRMRPKQVWLLCIPLFGFIWHFVVVKRIAESIQNEYESMRIYNNDTTTYNVGIAMCTLNICWFVPIIHNLAFIASLICFIIYWVRINSNKDKIAPFQKPGKRFFF